MPSLLNVVEYWWDRHGTDLYDILPHSLTRVEEPGCWACGWLTPPWISDDPNLPFEKRWELATKYLDRAHLIDRCFDGLDIAPNLVPLCVICHKEQPSYRPGMEENALSWVASHDVQPGFFQMFTDARDTGLERGDIVPLRKKFDKIQVAISELVETGKTSNKDVAKAAKALAPS